MARLAVVNADSYARSRNALDGAVTGLSPYFTHGIMGLPEAARALHQRQPLSFDDKLVFEFGWREFFHHVWSHAADGGDAILKDMHDGLPWPGRYAAAVPADIREARSGVPAVDNAVRTLYATGYLHNHARMWLASYMVHMRKVHWRAGADWLYGHLLDGDLPSNHLSWQWVAGTFSGKPYLFNADNVDRYAPAAAQSPWASHGTVIDASYEALAEIASARGDVGPEPGLHNGITEPPVTGTINASFMPPSQAIVESLAIDKVANRDLELVHPWNLAPRSSQAFRLGVIHLPAHTAWPWSHRRWQFVLAAMAEVSDAIWAGDLTLLDTAGATRVTAQACLFPGYRQALPRLAALTPAPRLLPDPVMACRSFTKFYQRVRRDTDQFSDLL